MTWVDVLAYLKAIPTALTVLRPAGSTRLLGVRNQIAWTRLVAQLVKAYETASGKFSAGATKWS